MRGQHHYAFGHIALRQLFFQSPPGLVAALVSRGDELLKRIWDDIGDQVAAADGEATRLSSDGLACTLHKIGKETVAVIVSMPPPQKTAEAHLLGLVLRVPRKDMRGASGHEKGMARYITLELGNRLPDGGRRTVLCEWRGEAHCNMGTGPQATVRAFVHKLAEMVANQDA